MARIIYGISGEGWGHAARSLPVLSHLQSKGHELQIVTYDKGIRYLGGRFPLVEVEGFNIATVHNRVSVTRTMSDGIRHLIRGHRRYEEMKKQLFASFRPEVVITDFEPMTAHLARHLRVPLISIDNQQFIRFVEFPCPAEHEVSMLMAKTVITAFIPEPDLVFVTAFYPGKPTNSRVRICPPILGEDVMALTPSEGESTLVYLSYGHKRLVETLAGFPEERFLVYGSERSGSEGNVTFRPYGRKSFLADLASSKAVIASAGFSLISEALHLKKPYLGIPVKNQFEQEINAHLIKVLGYGEYTADPGRQDVEDFLANVEYYRRRLAAYRSPGNSFLLSQLDEGLASLGHRRRPAGEFEG